MEPLVLRTALGHHAHVQPLRDGSVASARLRFDFVDYDPLPKAFRALVRGQDDLDVGEIALTTHLLALEAGKPLSALAIPLWRRLHHANLVCRMASPIRHPKQMEGLRVGVRAWSQTTGVWIRSILASEYGVDLGAITWVTIEDAHVAEYADPPGVERDRSGRSLRDLLLAGDLDAIMGERTVDPSGVRPVIADAEVAGKAWSARTGVLPVNHLVAVRSERLQACPWLAEELTRLFEAARAAAVASGMPVPPYGLEANGKAIQMLCGFAAAQKLTSRVYRAEDLFAPPVGETAGAVA